MVFHAEGISLLGGKRIIIVEEIKRDENTGHISNIEVRHYRKRKRYDEHLVFAVLYDIFNAEEDEREIDEVVDPHRIMLHNDSICTERIKRGENDRHRSVALSCGFNIRTEGKSAKSRLQKEHDKQRFGDMSFGKKCDDRRKRACDIVPYYTEELSAERTPEGIKQTSAFRDYIAERLEEVDVLSVQVEHKHAVLTERVHFHRYIDQPHDRGGKEEAYKKVFALSERFTPEILYAVSFKTYIRELFAFFGSG